MGITWQQAQNWPMSRRMADAYGIQWAVVYTITEGLAAELASSEQIADARAVELQRQGHKAWYVLLEDDGLGLESED